MRTLLLLLLLPAIALPAAAADTLYRWTDEDGVVHYTDTPPSGDDYDTRTIVADPPPPPPAPAQTPEQLAQAERCERLQANLATLQDNEQVRMDLDGDGESEPLSPEQRQQQVERTTNQIARLCTVPEVEPAG